MCIYIYITRFLYDLPDSPNFLVYLRVTRASHLQRWFRASTSRWWSWSCGGSAGWLVSIGEGTAHLHHHVAWSPTSMGNPWETMGGNGLWNGWTVVFPTNSSLLVWLPWMNSIEPKSTLGCSPLLTVLLVASIWKTQEPIERPKICVTV